LRELFSNSKKIFQDFKACFGLRLAYQIFY
jgi:hypothetical protein